MIGNTIKSTKYFTSQVIYIFHTMSEFGATFNQTIFKGSSVLARPDQSVFLEHQPTSLQNLICKINVEEFAALLAVIEENKRFNKHRMFLKNLQVFKTSLIGCQIILTSNIILHNFILFYQYNESGQFNEIRPHKDENLAFNSVKTTIWECYL